jgi:hypothetical protein
MMKLSLAVTLLFAVACKTESPAPAPSAAPAAESTGHARSAKIDIKPVAPPTPSATAPADPPHVDPAAREAWRERREAKIDTDGDGKVSEAERAAALQERVANMHARLDTDGDGKLSAGRARMRFEDPAALDTNHDGDISPDELAAAMKMQRERRAARRGGGDAAAPTTPPETTTP